MSDKGDVTVVLRTAEEGDLERLAELFTKTVRTLGPAYYSHDQVEAWAAAACDRAKFRAWILDAETLVAEQDGQVVGFCGIARDGHITGLYVDAAWTRKGIGRRLLEEILQVGVREGIARCYAEANPLSLPVFLRAGFVQTGTEVVERQGASFTRDLVEKTLA